MIKLYCQGALILIDLSTCDTFGVHTAQSVILRLLLFYWKLACRGDFKVNLSTMVQSFHPTRPFIMPPQDGPPSSAKPEESFGSVSQKRLQSDLWPSRLHFYPATALGIAHRFPWKSRWTTTHLHSTNGSFASLQTIFSSNV